MLPRQVSIVEHELILGIELLRHGREIGRTREYGGVVDHHDLVVRDQDMRIDPDRNPPATQRTRGATSLAAATDARVPAVQQDEGAIVECPPEPAPRKR